MNLKIATCLLLLVVMFLAVASNASGNCSSHTEVKFCAAEAYFTNKSVVEGKMSGGSYIPDKLHWSIMVTYKPEEPCASITVALNGVEKNYSRFFHGGKGFVNDAMDEKPILEKISEDSAEGKVSPEILNKRRSELIVPGSPALNAIANNMSIGNVTCTIHYTPKDKSEKEQEDKFSNERKSEKAIEDWVENEMQRERQAPDYEKKLMDSYKKDKERKDLENTITKTRYSLDAHVMESIREYKNAIRDLFPGLSKSEKQKMLQEVGQLKNEVLGFKRATDPVVGDPFQLGKSYNWDSWDSERGDSYYGGKLPHKCIQAMRSEGLGLDTIRKLSALSLRKMSERQVCMTTKKLLRDIERQERILRNGSCPSYLVESYQKTIKDARRSVNSVCYRYRK